MKTLDEIVNNYEEWSVFLDDSGSEDYYNEEYDEGLYCD